MERVGFNTVMTEAEAGSIREQARFKGIFDKQIYKEGRFERKILFSSVQRYAEERNFIDQAFESGFDGRQVGELKKELSGYMGIEYAVPLHSGTAALHMAVKLAAEKLYGSSTGISTPDGVGRGGALSGKRVFCSDFTAQAVIAPVIYEGGEPVFIDSSDLDWSMDPEVLQLTFAKYPDVKIVVMNHAYGFPGQILEIRRLCDEHGALLIECAGESFGAGVWTGSGGRNSDRPATGAADGVWKKVGTFGDYGVLDFGADGMNMGTSGGALLTRDFYASEKAAYWACGSKAATPWNQHEELGYQYAMDDLAAAVIRGQLVHMEEHIAKKKAVYERYADRLDGNLACLIPVGDGTRPNYQISCMTCESNIQFEETRSERKYTYTKQHGTAAPMEIYDALMAFNVESRPTYKPMSMQPLFRNYEHFTLDGAWRCYENFRNDTFWLRCDRARQYYESGLCLPSDVGMTAKEQERVMEVVLGCYNG